MNKKLGTVIQYLFFLGLGLFFVWLSVRDIRSGDNWEQIKFALSHAQYWLLGPVFTILLLSHYLRALRWRLLIEPLGYRPDRANMFFAVMIGYLANQVFPRLGEVFKCTLLSRYEKIPADKLVGTIILERLIDAVCLLLVFGITLAIQPGLYGQLVDSIFNNKVQETDKTPGYVIPLIVFGIIILAIALWMIIRKKTFRDVWQKIAGIGKRIAQGLGAIRYVKKKGQFLLMTVLIWVMYLAGGYIGFQALQETQQYGVKEAFTVLSAGSIGMIVSPGGIGGYPLLIEGTMVLYGLPKGIAAAFGWLLWLAQTAIILIGGLFSFAMLPWHNRRRSPNAA